MGVLPDFSGSQSPGGGAGLGGAGRRELRGSQGARCKEGRGGQSSSRLASAMVFTRGSQERLSWALAYLFSTLFLQILFRESSGTPVIHFLGPENPQPLSTCQLSGEKSGGIERKEWEWRHEVTAGQGSLACLPLPSPWGRGAEWGWRVQEQPDLRHWRHGSIFKHRTIQSVREHPTSGWAPMCWGQGE